MIGWLFWLSPQTFAAEFRLQDQHGHALANAVVTLDAAAPATTETDDVVVVEQRGQQFNPRVTVISPGAAVRFPNRDLTQHHVYSFSAAKVFEIALYGGDAPAPITFETTGIVSLGCNIHDWMLGYVYVSPDPYFGVTDEFGHVRLPINLTATDTLTIWHPGIEGSKPLLLSASALPAVHDGITNLTIEIPAGDPLVFDPDPLQSLFEDLSK